MASRAISRNNISGDAIVITPYPIAHMEEKQKIITISKEELSTLPAAVYEGNIILVDTPDAAKKAAAKLKKERLIGFDTETKPSFKRGQSHQVSLLQLSTHTECYLFRLNHIGLTKEVKEILEDKNILKVGLSIHDDFHNLHKISSGFNPEGFVDLQQYVKQYLISDNSLARIYAIIFGKRISKGQRLTNWEAEELTSHQQAYAALDALSCIRIYDYLSEGRFDPSASPHLKEVTEEHETKND